MTRISTKLGYFITHKFLHIHVYNDLTYIVEFVVVEIYASKDIVDTIVVDSLAVDTIFVDSIAVDIIVFRDCYPYPQKLHSFQMSTSFEATISKIHQNMCFMFPNLEPIQV